MVMEAQLEAAVSCDLAQLVQAVAQLIPLFVGGDRLVVTEHRVLLCEQAAGQLAYVDAACTDSLEEIQLLDKCLFVLLVGGRAQEAREPLGCNLDAAQVECLVQYGRVGRELAANLGALKACQSRLGNHLLEGQLAAELRHVVIGPADRRNAEFYIVEHLS